MFLVSLLSVAIFAFYQSWQFFLGRSCVLEVLIMVLFAGFSLWSVIKCKMSPNYKDYIPESLILLLNFLILVPAELTESGLLVLLMQFAIHMSLVVLTCKKIEDTRIYSILYSFMLFCYPVAYRIALVDCFFSNLRKYNIKPHFEQHSFFDLNGECIICVSCLFFIGSLSLAYKTFASKK